jgi:hypothetical protein
MAMALMAPDAAAFVFSVGVTGQCQAHGRAVIEIEGRPEARCRSADDGITGAECGSGYVIQWNASRLRNPGAAESRRFFFHECACADPRRRTGSQLRGTQSDARGRQGAGFAVE